MHGLSACGALTKTTFFTFRESIAGIKFEKISDPDITFPDTLHEKVPTKPTSKKVQSRINPKPQTNAVKFVDKLKKLRKKLIHIMYFLERN